MKKAVIVVKPVPESSGVSDDQIVKEILAEAKIPWAENIEKITIRRNVKLLKEKINVKKVCTCEVFLGYIFFKRLITYILTIYQYRAYLHCLHGSAKKKKKREKSRNI